MRRRHRAPADGHRKSTHDGASPISAHDLYWLTIAALSVVATIAYVTSDASYRHTVIVEDWLFDRLGPTLYAVASWALLAGLVSISAWMVYTDIGRALGWNS